MQNDHQFSVHKMVLETFFQRVEHLILFFDFFVHFDFFRHRKQTISSSMWRNPIYFFRIHLPCLWILPEFCHVSVVHWNRKTSEISEQDYFDWGRSSVRPTYCREPWRDFLFLVFELPISYEVLRNPLCLYCFFPDLKIVSRIETCKILLKHVINALD